MDANVITQMIASLGFPIIMCGALGYYVKHSNDAHREDMNKMIEDNRKQIADITESHREEISSITEAINNNTTALKVLCTKIGVDYNEDI